MARKPSVRLLPRKGALPILLDRAPVPVAIIVGFGLILLGALIVTRPLTSIVLLGIYVGCSAIVSGLAELLGRRGERAWWPRLVASVWLVSGAMRGRPRLSGLPVLVFTRKVTSGASKLTVLAWSTTTWIAISRHCARAPSLASGTAMGSQNDGSSSAFSGSPVATQ